MRIVNLSYPDTALPVFDRDHQQRRCGLGNSFTYSLFAPGYNGNVLNEGSVGTSYAAPCPGVAALMVQANPGLTASQIIARIQAGATPFPSRPRRRRAACHIAALTTDSAGNYTDVQALECSAPPAPVVRAC
jgi:subtilisin family serine protease